MSNFSFVVFNDTEGLSRVNVTALQKVDFGRILILVVMMGKETPTSDFNKLLIKGTLDSCKVSTGFLGSFVSKMIVDSLAQYSNWTFGCPQKGQYFSGHNFPVFDAVNLPYSLIGLDGDFEVLVNVKVKVARVKSLVAAFSIRIRGSSD